MSSIMNIETKELTMSSKQISELVDSRHDTVKKSIERLKNQGVITFTSTAEKSSGGRPGTVYHVNERDSYVVVAQLSPEFTAKLVDEWIRMKKKQQPQLPDFTNPAIAAEAWAKEYRAKEQALLEKQEAEEKVRLAAPKVNHYDTVVVKKNLINATQVGSKFKMSARALNKHLDDFDVYNKGVTRSRVFRQWFIDKGYGEVRQTDDGYTQSLFTMAGEAWVIEKLTGEGII